MNENKVNNIKIKENIRVSVKCPNCQHRVFDKMGVSSGILEMKCPRCRQIIKIDLSLRKRRILYRKYPA